MTSSDISLNGCQERLLHINVPYCFLIFRQRKNKTVWGYFMRDCWNILTNTVHTIVRHRSWSGKSNFWSHISSNLTRIHTINPWELDCIEKASFFGVYSCIGTISKHITWDDGEIWRRPHPMYLRSREDGTHAFPIFSWERCSCERIIFSVLVFIVVVN